jgi:hypothetical protein
MVVFAWAGFGRRLRPHTFGTVHISGLNDLDPLRNSFLVKDTDLMELDDLIYFVHTKV